MRDLYTRIELPLPPSKPGDIVTCEHAVTEPLELGHLSSVQEQTTMGGELRPVWPRTMDPRCWVVTDIRVGFDGLTTLFASAGAIPMETLDRTPIARMALIAGMRIQVSFRRIDRPNLHPERAWLVAWHTPPPR